MEMLNDWYKHKGDPWWYLSIMPRRHARHEECIKIKFHIFYISVTGTLQVSYWLEALITFTLMKDTIMPGETDVGWDPTTAYTSWQTVLPLLVTVAWISIPQPITCWMENSSLLIYPQQDNFFKRFSLSVGFLKTTNLHYRNMCSCQWNQLSAQYSQYISSILFITSTCFGPLQVYHQED